MADVNDIALDNVAVSTIGEIALRAGNPKRKDVGDQIDRGLIMIRLLRERGYDVIRKDKP